MIKTGFARRSLITGMIALVLVLAAFLMLSASAGAEAYGSTTVSRYTGNTYTHSSALGDVLIVDGVDVSYIQKNNVDWQQAKADGIDFNIGKAAAEGIVLNSSVTLPQAEHIVIYVYDKNNRNVSIVLEKDKNTQTEQFVLTPKKMLIYDLSFEQELKYEEDIPENQFVSGEKYRVCCVVLDKDRNVIYCWHEYVTIQ